MFSSTPHEEREEACQPQADTREQPRFPLALKKARLARQLKQETLAAQLHVKLRTLVSWETGTRIPSIGMVVLLGLLLTDGLEMSNDLLRAYIIDDLAHHVRLQEDHEFRERAMQAIQLLQGIPSKAKEQREEAKPLLADDLMRGDRGQERVEGERTLWQQQQVQEGMTEDTLEQLFSLLEWLRQQPALIPVAHGFLREMAMPSSADESTS